MRKALCVGINYYENANCLRGAVNDAKAIARTLATHYNGTKNFDVTLMTAQTPEEAISRSELRNAVMELFSGSPKVALFYFAGHGTHDRYGGYLCASDGRLGEPEDGLSLEYLMNIVRESKAENKIIILDSCFSGFAGNYANLGGIASLPGNTTILAACQWYEPSKEPKGRGLFTSLMYEALNGGAMNVVGHVTPTSIYDYVEKSLSPWEQRPVFKANIETSLCLRVNKPPIDIQDLRKIVDIFYDPHEPLPLNPHYEEDKNYTTDKSRHPELEATFKILRKYHQLNLVVPHESEEYMYWAAINSKSCHLTARGRQYWNMVAKGLI